MDLRATTTAEAASVRPLTVARLELNGDHPERKIPASQITVSPPENARCSRPSIEALLSTKWREMKTSLGSRGSFVLMCHGVGSENSTPIAPYMARVRELATSRN